jgi:hypothetical protein
MTDPVNVTRREGESLADFSRRLHKAQHPNCTYGDTPHYVPPSFGQIGFYACDPPADLTNYERRDLTSPYMAPEVADEIRAERAAGKDTE